MKENDSPTPEQVVEAIKQLGAAAGGDSPGAESVLEKWRESLGKHRLAAEVASADNCNDPL